MITVGHPRATGSGPAQASKILSPMRAAGRLLIITVPLPLVTNPGPWGGMGQGIGQMCMSLIGAMLDTVADAAIAAVALMPSVYAWLAAGSAPGTADAVVHVAVRATLVALSVATWLAAVPAAAGAPAGMAGMAKAMRNPDIWAREGVASAGVITGLFINVSMVLDKFSRAGPTEEGSARHAGKKPIITSRLPGPGVIGVPWPVESETRAASGIVQLSSLIKEMTNLVTV